MTTIEKDLSAYEADVEFPDVSGMEHLQMLMTRSALHRVEAQLTPAQKKRLAKADESLLQQADLFYQAVQTIADLARWRETEEGVTPEHWWWYLERAGAPAAGVVLAEFSGFPEP